jgi:hypothetical protein
MNLSVEFKTLAEAEDYLIRLGFNLVPDTCGWRNEAGDGAGCYPIERKPGTVTGFRVEINRVSHVINERPRQTRDGIAG